MVKLIKEISKKIIFPLVTVVALSGNSFANQRELLDIKKIYLTSCVNEEICSSNSKDVSLEDIVKLNVVLEGDQNGEKIYFSSEKNIKINGKKIDPSTVRSLDFKPSSIKWFKLESEKTDYNNWANGDFIWDDIRYTETLIDNDNNLSISADANPSDKSKDVNNGLGTMRYKVEVTYGNKKLSTPGKESKNSRGIKKNVHRISFRKDDSFLGRLTAFFNLPYIYGSAGRNNTDNQPENYIGSDCADLMVWAYRNTGKDIDYTYAAGLTKITETILKEKNLFTDGESYYDRDKQLIFGEDVKKGDLILFGKWHVGAISEDKSNPNGKFKGGPDKIFNKYDLMIHTYFDSPKIENVDGYGPFSILRWKN